MKSINLFTHTTMSDLFESKHPELALALAVRAHIRPVRITVNNH